MNSGKESRPYFERWLRRTRKQFAVSGRLSQVAFVLAQEGEGTEAEWCTRLRTLLEGEETPSMELLTQIDALLAGQPSITPRKNDQDDFPAIL